MEFIVLFMGFVAWSLLTFLAGLYFGAKMGAAKVLDFFDKDKLKEAWKEERPKL